jgi:hypothetical protein
MNESRLITANRVSQTPIPEDFTTDPISLVSKCSKKLLPGFDSFFIREIFPSFTAEERNRMRFGLRISFRRLLPVLLLALQTLNHSPE